MFMISVDTVTELGRLIREERKAQKLTQLQLAGLVGVGVRFVRELEAGKETCQIGRAFQVISTLGLSIAVTGRRDIGR